MKRNLSPDRLNETVGVLVRREIEVRLLIPLLEELGDEFGRDRILAVLARTIENIAREQGREAAERLGDNSLAAFEASLEAWTRGGAMERLPIDTGSRRVRFDVTRCRYAEMYHEIGAADIGFLFSCARDAAWMEGFNPAVRMERTRTIMQGDTRCDFCYEVGENGKTEISVKPVRQEKAVEKAAEQSLPPKKKYSGMYAMDIDVPTTVGTVPSSLPEKKRPDVWSGRQFWKQMQYLLLIVLLLVGLYLAQFGIQRLLAR